MLHKQNNALKIELLCQSLTLSNCVPPINYVLSSSHKLKAVGALTAILPKHK